jgi:cytochrome o ubiquinol oxidase subunit 2
MKKLPVFLLILVIISVIGWFLFLIRFADFQVLNPAGFISAQQSLLIKGAMGFMLAIAIPVLIIGLFIGWKYRSGNSKSQHEVDWTGKNWLKAGYWIFFGCMVAIFWVVVWISAHALDPYKPIASNQKPITIQVVALDWKWLFIYPEQNIATVNFLQIPVNTPVVFKLTADGPMNSFWIPNLSGQIYSMTGMQTTLNMLANKVGDYPGGAAEINGKGFSGMRFITRVTTPGEFNNWIDWVRISPNKLDKLTFAKLNRPSENNPIEYYSTVSEDLYNSIVMKYMPPSPTPGMFDSDSTEMNMEDANAR